MASVNEDEKGLKIRDAYFSWLRRLLYLLDFLLRTAVK